MGYTVLPLRYRPQQFQDLIGQEEIVRTLVNGINSRRLAHAYLFFGPRGIGKTTIARILAKSLNCERDITPTPCGECTSCVEITESRSMDVHEIDGASHTGVDHIRELKDIIIYPPARDRYKIFIIDEVHMLSTSAFNALLKTLEEPPPHAVFMFATTEKHKIPATILSRCQQFALHTIPFQTMRAHLDSIMQREEIMASSSTVNRIIRVSEGCVRDALSLLDQLVNLSGKEIQDDLVIQLLGEMPFQTISDLFGRIFNGDREGVLNSLKEMKNQGVVMPRLYDNCLTFLRELIGFHLNDPLDLLTPAEREAVEQAARNTSYEQALRSYNFLIRERYLIVRTEKPSMVSELIFLKLAELPSLTRLEDIVSGRTVVPVTGPGSPAHPVAPVSGERKQKGPTTSPQSGSVMDRFHQELERKSPVLAGYVDNARAEMEADRLVLTFQEDLRMSYERLMEKENHDVVESVAKHHFGPDVLLEVLLKENEKNPLLEMAEKNESVQNILTVFKGSIEEVRPGPDELPPEQNEEEEE